MPAKAGQKAALLAYEAAIQNAFADVENALSSRQKLGDQLAAEERLVQALRDYARLARLQYDGGYTSYLTVLVAQQQLFPAELNFTATRAAVFIRSPIATRPRVAAGSTRRTRPRPAGAGWLVYPAVGAAAPAGPPTDEPAR